MNKLMDKDSLIYVSLYSPFECIEDLFINGEKKFTKGKVYYNETSHRLLMDSPYYGAKPLFVGCIFASDYGGKDMIPLPTETIIKHFTRTVSR